MEILKLASKIDPDGHLRLDLPTRLAEGDIEIVVIINPVEEKHKVGNYDFSDLAGKLTWQGNAVATQRELRDEW